MDHAGWVIFAVVALMVLQVLVPYGLAIYYSLRGSRPLTCPQAGSDAFVSVDALKTAVLRPFTDREPHVLACTEWPARAGCLQNCVRQLQA